MAMNPQLWDAQQFDPTKEWWRLSEVEKYTFRKAQTLYALMAKGKFPVPAKLSPRISVWRKDEVEQWLIDSVKENGSGVVVVTK